MANVVRPRNTDYSSSDEIGGSKTLLSSKIKRAYAFRDLGSIDIFITKRLTESWVYLVRRPQSIEQLWVLMINPLCLVFINLNLWHCLQSLPKSQWQCQSNRFHLRRTLTVGLICLILLCSSFRRELVFSSAMICEKLWRRWTALILLVNALTTFD